MSEADGAHDEAARTGDGRIAGEGSDLSPTGRHHKWFFAGGSAVAITAVLVVLGFGMLRSRGSDSLGFELPAATPSAAMATADYLRSDAPQLLEVHRASLELGGGLTEPACTDTASRLEQETPPEVVLALAVKVPDPLLAEAFGRQRRALGVALTSCIQDGVASSEDLDEISQVIESRLDQFGVAS